MLPKAGPMITEHHSESAEVKEGMNPTNYPERTVTNTAILLDGTTTCTQWPTQPYCLMGPSHVHSDPHSHTVRWDHMYTVTHTAILLDGTTTCTQ